MPAHNNEWTVAHFYCKHTARLMNHSDDSAIRAWIQAMPKTETHLHIEGALPYSLLQTLDPQQFSQQPPSWQPDFRWPSFEAFEADLIAKASLWFTSEQRYHTAAKQLFAGLAEQNVRYVETSFHAGMIEFLGLSGEGILAAIQSAAPAGMEVRVFMGMARNGATPAMRPILEQSIHWSGLAGLDLHGVETLPLEAWTLDLWRAAGEQGLCLKAHAGEFGPAANVAQAIQQLGVRRIQHGVRAIEDPQVVELAVAQGVTFDVCPISNVKLQVVPEMAQHPIRALLAAGLACTVSTDDPLSFGNTLTDEYTALYSELNFTAQELAHVAKNGFQVALVDEAQRHTWIEAVDTWLATSPMGEL